MPRNSKGKGKSPKGSKGRDDGMLRLSSGRFLLEMPRPRLPAWIGTPNLRQGLAIYPRVNLDVPIQMSTMGVVAGGLAQVANIDTSQIPNFATRFGATFKEFAIVGARFEVRLCTSAVPQGLILCYVDEDSNAAPTATAQNYAHAEIPIVGSSTDTTGSLHRIEWVARSYADLTWDAIGTSGVVGYLKMFAAAVTGTAATTTATLVLSGAFAICFRGYI